MITKQPNKTTHKQTQLNAVSLISQRLSWADARLPPESRTLASPPKKTKRSLARSGKLIVDG